jgi:hypothetical protein
VINFARILSLPRKAEGRGAEGILTSVLCRDRSRSVSKRREQGLVESRGDTIPRPSVLDPDVGVSVHLAPDVLGYFAFAHVLIIVATFVDCFKIILFPVGVISVDVVQVNPFLTNEFQPTGYTSMALPF